MKVAICDNNPTLTEKINMMLFNYNPNIFETYAYYNPLRLVNQLDQESFDFFILDMEMSKMSGIDLARKIRERDILSPIVFLTSYKEYMGEAFQVQTSDYLLKPPTEDRLHQVLEKPRQQLEKGRNYFIFSNNKATYKIPTKDIICFKRDERQVLIHTVGEIHKPYISANQINEQLDTNSMQVHSPFIISCAYVKGLRENFLLMNSKEKCIEIPVSRRFKTTAHKNVVISMREKI